MRKLRVSSFIKLYVRPYIKEQLICFILLMITAASSVAFPYFLKLVIDDAIGKGSERNLLIYTTGMLLVICVMAVSKYFQSIKFLELGQKMTLKLKTDMIIRLSQYCMPFFKKYKNGEIISILERDVLILNKVITYTISDILISFFTGTGLLIILFNMNFFIGSIASVTIIIFAFMQRKYGKRSKYFARSLSVKKGHVQSTTIEIVNKIIDIIVFNCINIFEHKFTKITSEYYDLEKDMLRVRMKSNLLGLMFQSLGILLVLFYGGSMVLQEKMTLGVLFSLTIYIQRIYAPVQSISKAYIDIKNSQASFSRVQEILNNDEYLQSYGEKSVDLNDKNMIIINDLNFSHDTNILFENTSLRINNGEKICLVGHNGVGKSTLTNILSGLQKDYIGNISIGGVDLNYIKKDTLRNILSVYRQSDAVFNTSIKENILLGRNITRSRLDEILTIVELIDDIKQFEEGIDTVVGEGGIKLSGGQAQKINLARCLVYLQPLIILDEPTSALDMESEKRICKNLFSEAKNSTIVVITHRKEIMKYCNRIIEIDNKNIVEKTS